MDLTNNIKNLSRRVRELKGSITTEEATKTSLVMPFFNVLGYDVFNPLEFCPEYVADYGIKKGEKVDYAIIKDGNPIILVECKSCKENLDRHGSQLYRYFGTTKAKFGILTNGVEYRFYTDLDEVNKMDLKPFLIVNIEDLNDVSISELGKFCKGEFDIDRIHSSAENMRYSTLIREKVSSELSSPSDDFIKFILSDVYSGQKNQRVIEKFTPMIKRAISSYISELVKDSVSSVLEDSEEVLGVEESTKLVTTEEELEAYRIVQSILSEVVSLDDISYKDTVDYLGVLYKGSVRKTVCRLWLNSISKKHIRIPDGSNETKYPIDSINGIYKYKDVIVQSVKRYVD